MATRLRRKRRAADLKMNRAEYIRHAVAAMNRAVEEKKRNARLRSASLKVRGESMKVNAEFAAAPLGRAGDAFMQNVCAAIADVMDLRLA